jgi:secreted trypsin-like serine protease
MRVWSIVLTTAIAVSGFATPAHANPVQRDEVVGGVRADEGEFPWMVRLSVGCGGALIAPEVVLTAAHCVGRTRATDSVRVTAGSVDVRGNRAIVVRSEYVERAAGFRDAFHGRDWALVRLQRPLDLPTLRLAGDDRYDRGRFTIMGWGVTSEDSATQQRFLRTAQVPFVDDDACGHAYRSISGFVPDEMICAGYLDRGGVDTCQGDSGGPMVRKDSAGAWIQVGIVSFGYGCARSGTPGVYTQVSTFAADIDEAMRQL